MPLEITTRTISTGQSRPPSPSLFVDLPYTPITQCRYGRMDASAPTQGMCTSGVASCTVVVLHCAFTQRTVLTHSPNFLQMLTFVPMIDWVTGGRDVEMTEQERMAWFYPMSLTPPSPRSIDAVVLRGYDYASERAATYGHAAWMNDFRSLFRRAESRSIQSTIVDSPRLLETGSVLVDKGTGRISFLELSDSLKRKHRTILHIEAINSNLHPKYSSHSEIQDLLVGNALICRNPPTVIDLRLQHDMKEYKTAHPLNQELRLLLRSRTLGEPPSAQSAILRQQGLSVDWVGSTSFNSGITLSLLNRLVQIGMPCELCTKKWESRCSVCKGAWYCSAKHQKEDWKAHKVWCKKNPASK